MASRVASTAQAAVPGLMEHETAGPAAAAAATVEHQQRATNQVKDKNSSALPLYICHFCHWSLQVQLTGILVTRCLPHHTYGAGAIPRAGGSASHMSRHGEMQGSHQLPTL